MYTRANIVTDSRNDDKPQQNCHHTRKRHHSQCDSFDVVCFPGYGRFGYHHNKTSSCSFALFCHIKIFFPVMSYILCSIFPCIKIKLGYFYIFIRSQLPSICSYKCHMTAFTKFQLLHQIQNCLGTNIDNNQTALILCANTAATVQDIILIGKSAALIYKWVPAPPHNSRLLYHLLILGFPQLLHKSLNIGI